jgi:hypothetical protein
MDKLKSHSTPSRAIADILFAEIHCQKKIVKLYEEDCERLEAEKKLMGEKTSDMSKRFISIIADYHKLLLKRDHQIGVLTDFIKKEGHKFLLAEKAKKETKENSQAVEAANMVSDAEEERNSVNEEEIKGLILKHTTYPTVRLQSILMSIEDMCQRLKLPEQIYLDVYKFFQMNFDDIRMLKEFYTLKRLEEQKKLLTDDVKENN